MAVQDEKAPHKLDEATRKLLLGIVPFSADAVSDYNLVPDPESKIPKHARPVFKIRPFTKLEKSEATELYIKLQADGPNDEAVNEKVSEMARKATKHWTCLFDAANGNEIVYKANNADGGADETMFNNLPALTRGRLFLHAYTISGLGYSEKLGLK